MTKTVFLVGAGAIENGWDPVKRAIFKRRQTFPFNCDPNNYFAFLVHHVRAWDLAGKQDGEGVESGFITQVYARIDANLFRRELDELVSAIREELKTAVDDKEIRLRDEVETAWGYFCVESDAAIITTNWDTTIEQIDNALYLHGSIREDSPLLLPSESVREPYRSPEELDGFEERHEKAGELIRSATRIVIYGLSLSPLDVDLTTLLYRPKDETEVIIVDTCPDVVSSRVRLFQPNSRIQTLTPSEIRPFARGRAR